MLRFSRLRFAAGSLAVGSLAALFAACSNDESIIDHFPPPDGGPPDAAAPLDPAHCTFETPPIHAPGGVIAPGQVRAGVASVVLPMPIGAALGGYAARLPALGGAHAADARPRRFTKSFVPSVGLHDAPRAEALAIEVGGDKLVMIRVDTILINENNLFALESAVASDGSMRGRIIVSASHSHSAWAGWQTSMVLSPGIDLPRKELADRMIGAMASAAKDALAKLAPAKIGFAVDAAFDPADIVNRDRRGENDTIKGPDGNTAGAGKDPILWAMRVDAMDGKPMAAVVDLPIHGTIGGEDNPLASTDTAGAIERSLSASLGVPVLHFQGAAGDVSPAGTEGRKACPDSTRCLDMPRLEVVGARAAELIAPLVNSIQTSDKMAMEVVTRTFPVRRDAKVVRSDQSTVEYAPFDPEHTADGVLLDPSGRIASPIDEFNTTAGAGLCGDPNGGLGAVFPISGSAGIGPYSSCLELSKGRDVVFGLFDVVDKSPLPLCDTVRSTATAVRFSGTPSGDWLIVTAPGEPTAPFAAYLRGRSPAGKDRTLLIGYADDHAGYLLTAEDWVAGGYEPSINLWGPLEGEMIIDGVIEAAKIAWTPEREDPEAGSSRFVDWKFPDAAPVKQLVTTDHGKAATATPSIWWPDVKDPGALMPGAAVPRAVGAARFVWHGGDPAVDLPLVVIEKETSPNVFAPLLDAHGGPASSRHGAAVITYVPEPIDAAEPTSHLYAVVWQPVPPDPYTGAQPSAPYSLPLGKYRFHITGAALTGAGQVTYDLTSDPFDVIAAPLSAGSTATKSGTMVSIQALLGSAPGMRALRDAVSDSDLSLPGPWTVTVNLMGSPSKMVMVTPDTKGNGQISLSAAEIAAVVSVDVRDPAGNGGLLNVP